MKLAPIIKWKLGNFVVLWSSYGRSGDFHDFVLEGFKVDDWTLIVFEIDGPDVLAVLMIQFIKCFDEQLIIKLRL